MTTQLGEMGLRVRAVRIKSGMLPLVSLLHHLHLHY